MLLKERDLRFTTERAVDCTSIIDLFLLLFELLVNIVVIVFFGFSYLNVHVVYIWIL